MVWLTSHAEVSNKVTIGLNIDSTVIMADSMSFGHLIYHIETGPDQKHMLLKLREATKNGKNMFDVIAPDYNSFPIITEQGNIYTVDKELRISESYPASSLYWPIFTLGDRMCIHSNASGEQDIWVTTIQGIPEIKITVPVRGIRITKDKLYLYNNNHLYYISLDESAIKN